MAARASASAAQRAALRQHSTGISRAPLRRIAQGLLASGDGAHKIHVARPREGGAGWDVDQNAYIGHTGGVEDLAWSPVEAGVMMSCGCDSTVRVWDVRKKDGSALHVDEVSQCPIRR